MHAGLVGDAVPYFKAGELKQVGVAELSVGVVGIEAATVGDALDVNVLVVFVKLLSKEVTVGLCADGPGGSSHQDDLLGLRDLGVADQIIQQGRENVVAVEIEILSQLGGVPGSCVHITAAVGNVH